MQKNNIEINLNRQKKKIKQIAQCLKYLLNLKQINITLKHNKEELYFLKNIKQLEIINNRCIIKIIIIFLQIQKILNFQNNKKQIMRSQYINFNNKISKINKKIIFDDIRQMYQNNQFENNQELMQQFQNQVHLILNCLQQKNGLEENIFKQYMLQIKSKYTIYELCFSKIIDFAESIDSLFYNSLVSIHDSHALIFKQMSNQNYKIQFLQNNYNQYQQNTDNKNIVCFQKIYKQLIKIKYQNQLNELNEQIQQLKEENKQYLDKIIRLSKLQDNSYIKEYTKENFQQQESNKRTFRDHNCSQIQSFKYLHIKQLKEIINEIYTSKEWFDNKQIKQNLPSQTLEQHMYEYLSQKYGLKNMVIEQANVIINNLKKYSQEDNDVQVFTKILKNECDENFRYVQGQLKKTIQELLFMHLKGKNPLKTNETQNKWQIKELKDIQNLRNF
ncbi:hypothetical protein IMG5_061670 [Ichthyophthirius multifiliis]|uniref:Uncharacterized protein n=1 Tax=Ichthyophthirius multifiliis TaxID=5932 RepID=G0QNV7_ICHMU|nr:hypothetical protein IMG5_061670 [Ichthyophthirius multifiliis]EGR33111.1 hypothetical protein IMG5_061670 [Ichthyophthirius multifiliis]|eukprot:XP_004037097.1 hypothetical protein IMG5_061670 [Ichthyophthirius multifiliis]